jgi:ATP synthase protein I
MINIANHIEIFYTLRTKRWSHIVNLRYGAKGIKNLFYIQLFVAAMFVVLAMIYSGRSGAESAILGTFLYIIPNALYVRKIFHHQGARSAKKIVKGFYKAESLKFALSVVLFAVVFSMFNINPLIFFGAYVGMQMLIWFAPLIFT